MRYRLMRRVSNVPSRTKEPLRFLLLVDLTTMSLCFLLAVDHNESLNIPSKHCTPKPLLLDRLAQLLFFCRCLLAQHVDGCYKAFTGHDYLLCISNAWFRLWSGLNLYNLSWLSLGARAPRPRWPPTRPLICFNGGSCLSSALGRVLHFEAC